MGKGDRRTRRGKLFRGTFGATRKHKSGKPAVATATAPKSEAPKKKAARKKKED